MTSEEEAGPFDTLTTAVAEDTRDDDSRSRQEKEEKLILTAWQSMSSALRQHSLYKDSRAPGPAQSFLAEQRQSTRARRALSPRLQPG
ncbi:protein Hook homolog 2-like [Anarrhichthys ocellatus]|uniref:protein Hook homolog 2-like n=1 Tax=Anarrhichthys ocellatus TaxID=433405 RepID=UPI0012ED9EB8|nr:protein Hook homolog 2-like [Anarrhichthys ocellatus]